MTPSPIGFSSEATFKSLFLFLLYKTGCRLPCEGENLSANHNIVSHTPGAHRDEPYAGGRGTP